MILACVQAVSVAVHSVHCLVFLLFSESKISWDMLIQMTGLSIKRGEVEIK